MNCKLDRTIYYLEYQTPNLTQSEADINIRKNLWLINLRIKYNFKYYLSFKEPNYKQTFVIVNTSQKSINQNRVTPTQTQQLVEHVNVDFKKINMPFIQASIKIVESFFFINLQQNKVRDLKVYMGFFYGVYDQQNF
ncbi:hypothetical protein ABPG73_019595 [Tetrahymena malaccensis]